MPGSRLIRLPCLVAPKPRVRYDLPYSARLVREASRPDMSGIAGQIRLHGEIVARRDLERMVNALHRHGPERSNFVIAGTVGLAHALMRMTPEDQFCGQPLRGASGAILVADLRLDNRDDVLAATGVSKLEAAAWEDARVLL